MRPLSSANGDQAASMSRATPAIIFSKVFPSPSTTFVLVIAAPIGRMIAPRKTPKSGMPELSSRALLYASPAD